ncbi:uncharacterized protein LOC131225830 [Magnolia sinica]|uniref:uncharacterized protein LOC131225830 n=1 Tax=Magnolia sinica TaxID=86752 RepID=UPI0026597F05|nr:uncharacterized protein LOC131225830 [Magnolia sinica]
MQSRNVNYTTRCAPSKFFDFMNEVKLKDEHIKAIADTPFKEFMRFPRLPVQRTFLNSILDRWDNASSCFILGGKRVFIKPQDIVVILGLSMRGEYIDLKKKLDDCDKQLKDKYFPNVLLSRNLMEENIKKLLEQSLEESLTDFTKLFILYIFNTILFPNASQTTPKFLLHYVNNLEKMHSYAWATAVYEFLVRSISEGAKKKKGYVNGCVMILEPWLREHIILQPGLTTKMVYPRLLRWVGNNYQQAGTHKKYINSLIHTQVTEDITLTNEEKILLPPDKSNMVEEIRRYLEPVLLRIEEKIDTMLVLPTQLQKLRSEEK